MSCPSPGRRYLQTLSMLLMGVWITNSLLIIGDMFLDGAFFSSIQDKGGGWGDDDSYPWSRRHPLQPSFRRGVDIQNIGPSARRRPRRRPNNMAPLARRGPLCHHNEAETITVNGTQNAASLRNSTNTTDPCDDTNEFEFEERVEDENPYKAQIRRGPPGIKRHEKNAEDKGIKKRNNKSQPPPTENATVLTLPTPIIVMGFPKAGTSSIFSFFKNQRGMQNFRSQHWYCCRNQASPQTGGPSLMSECMVHNLVQNRSIFHKCGDFDLYAEINGPRPVVGLEVNPHLHIRPGLVLDDGSLDFASFVPPSRRRWQITGANSGSSVHRIFFPQYFNIQDIHDHYPNATFILNTRPFDSWIKSVQDCGDDLDWQFVNEFYSRGELLDYLPNDRHNQTEMAELMKIIYDRHHEKVRQFVLDHPSHVMIEVPILDPNASSILGEAFGLNASLWSQMNSKENRAALLAAKAAMAGFSIYDTTMTGLENLFLDALDDNPILTFLSLFASLLGPIYLILNWTHRAQKHMKEQARNRRQQKV